MPDTIRRPFLGQACSDCGVKNVSYYHQHGVLIPPGTAGYFCQGCFTVRSGRLQVGQAPLPIGVTIYTERCKNKKVLITFPHSRDVIRTFILLIFSAKLDVAVVEHNIGEIRFFEFFWSDNLDTIKVNSVLNELRREYPEIAISAGD